MKTLHRTIVVRGFPLNTAALKTSVVPDPQNSVTKFVKLFVCARRRLPYMLCSKAMNRASTLQPFASGASLRTAPALSLTLPRGKFARTRNLPNLWRDHTGRTVLDEKKTAIKWCQCCRTLHFLPHSASMCSQPPTQSPVLDGPSEVFSPPLLHPLCTFQVRCVQCAF